MDKQEKKVVRPKPWTFKKPPYQIGVDGFTTKDKSKKEDLDGWVPELYCRPISFDLVLIRTTEEKTKTGWWNGRKWEGYRIKDEDIVMCWKPKREETY